MKILFFTDPHFMSNNLSCRKDYFPETLFNKMVQVMEIARESKVDIVVCGGDFFHSFKVKFSYLYRLFSLFRDFSIPIVSVIGNHDIDNADLTTVDRGPLGLFFGTGVFAFNLPVSCVEYDDAVLVFVHFFLEAPHLDISQYMETPKRKVLFAHQYFPGQFPTESLPEEMAHMFDYIFLGHDHDVFPPVRLGKAHIIRPGSLSRGTRIKSNWFRDVFVAILDTQSGSCEYRKLKVAPAMEVFHPLLKDIVFDSGKNEDLVRALSTVKISSGLDLNSLLDSMGVVPELRARVVYWLKSVSLI